MASGTGGFSVSNQGLYAHLTLRCYPPCEAFVETDHTKRTKANGIEAADEHLARLIAALNARCGVAEEAEVPDEEPEAVGLTVDQLREAGEVFGLVAGLCGGGGGLLKEELVKAQGGDFHLFEHIDSHQTGDISKEEWNAWLQASENQILKLHALSDYYHIWTYVLQASENQSCML